MIKDRRIWAYLVAAFVVVGGTVAVWSSLSARGPSRPLLQYGDAFPLATDSWTVCAVVSTRCRACEVLYPALKQLRSDSEHFDVLFEIVWAGVESESRQVISQKGLQSWTHLFMSTAQTKSLLGVRFLPTVFLVGPSGQVCFVQEAASAEGSGLEPIQRKLEQLSSTEGG